MPPTDTPGRFLAHLQSNPPAFLPAPLERSCYPPGLRGRIAWYRGLARLQFRRILYAWGGAGGLFLALAAGTSEYTDPRTAALFRAAGLAHVLALSGMHLSIFSGLSRRAAKKAGKRGSELLGVLLVLLFVWFAGFTPSLRRALIFFLLGFLCKVVGKSAGGIQLLSLTFFIHVFWKPQEIAALSFMLSYGGLGGILLFGEGLRPLLVRLRLPTASSLAASLGAFMATSPVSALAFGYLTPVSILSSTVVSPLITLFMTGGILCTLVSIAVPVLVFPLGSAMGALYRILAWLAELFSQVPRIDVGGG
jgi:competence protein ComEC